jgi:hypothetical protein
MVLAMPMFWSILADTADNWDPAKLRHLLSYGLGRKSEEGAARITTARQVVRFYKRAFDRLDQDEKFARFRELLLSFYVTDEFQQALQAARRRRLGTEVIGHADR